MSSPSFGPDTEKQLKAREDVLDTKHFVAAEPFANFKHWFDIACKTDGIARPNAMALATATNHGKPSVRMVVLKGYDTKGFKFGTTYTSRKGKELEENPCASLLFYWLNVASQEDQWARQVRIEGQVEKLSEEESIEHFHSYPKCGQIVISECKQGTVVASRQVLEDSGKRLIEEYKYAESLPKPDYWGAYILKPESFDFLQSPPYGFPGDRFLFRKRPGATDNTAAESWIVERLAL